MGLTEKHGPDTKEHICFAEGLGRYYMGDGEGELARLLSSRMT